MTPEEIITIAESYIGTRWHHQGRSRAGMDCIGLVVCVAQDSGAHPHDQTGYGRQPFEGRLRAALDGFATRIEKPEPAAIVLFKFEKNPMHVGICGRDDEIIHALASMRKVVKHRIDDTWSRRIVACYRFPGVTHG